ncbi:PEP-CTERM sorting domain-containing protein [Alkalimonas amylolytica]|uniref:PEP-CTERM protein-sorting domain-containing protein n=1 Tax=Alkalimonas amylolytica TaxID=152573 RepID=A0A1H4CFH4_ALKAM|nr:PEP-CTERM sorting domain-containing protein [Alkalimonas amylolytica]SEA59094.1 PEP-CTERM protein-sorting domain-containing protein [Alkalimonas amylolytica]
MKKLQVALLTAGLFSVGSVQASPISFDFFNAHETTEIQQTGSLSMFDDALGNLTSVTLNLLGESISSTILDNQASNGQTFSYLSQLSFFFDILGLSNNITLPAPTFITTLATTNGFATLASGTQLDLGTNTEQGAYSFTFTDPMDIAAFVGAGSFTVNCNTLSSSGFTGGGGNIDTNQVTTGACGAEVIYSYNTPTTSISEPMTLWLFGAGLFGFAAMRRFS